MDALAAEVGGRVPADAALLDEVTNLVEVPTALRGAFDADFLRLPREVLVAVMRAHQRYFPLEDGDGQLLPWFIAVRNGDERGLDNVIAGNEQVLRARFSDARFFYEEDLRRPLADYLPRLATLTFHERLGSMLDKNRRVADLIADTGATLQFGEGAIGEAQAAAQLARADLATQMVVEMTALQGVMGCEYALRSGAAPAVGAAIREFWQPRSAEDGLPASDAGVLLALTDRLDSLVGLFAAGVVPRANADPYGLRRGALGVIRILCDRGMDVGVDALLESVAAAQPVEVSDATRQATLDFLTGRLQAWLGEQGFAAELLEAVLAQQAANPWRAFAECPPAESLERAVGLAGDSGRLRALRAHHARRAAPLPGAGRADTRAAGTGAAGRAAESATCAVPVPRRRRFSLRVRSAGAGYRRLLRWGARECGGGSPAPQSPGAVAGHRRAAGGLRGPLPAERILAGAGCRAVGHTNLAEIRQLT